MGVSYRNNGNIKDFWPDDTDSEFYLEYGTDLGTILRKAAEKWPNVDVRDIQVDAEYTHTSCLTFDLYDPSDYTNFIVVRRLK